jgi:peptidoglycan/xylan/chitin deacetylase (PgdA/CDA1 family)
LLQIEKASDQQEYRKKRVKRIKKIIVAIVIALLVVPTILSFFLMYRISCLEREMNQLLLQQNIKKEAANVLHAATVPNREGNGKKVYLTFDDGPSCHTVKILNTLRDNHVKGTFFVVGKEDKYSKAVYKRIVSDGNTIGMHSYSHMGKEIYRSVDSFEKDTDRLQKLIQKVTGIRPTFYRFPGGSSNIDSQIPVKDFIEVLEQRGISYMDWNVVDGTSDSSITKKQMVQKVLNGVSQFNVSVVQFHDSANSDVLIKALPEIIQKLQKKGYNLQPISEETTPIRHTK